MQVGDAASLWYGSVVRGDVNHIVIGSGSSVGDSAVVHVAGLAGDKPTIVGSNVVIGELDSYVVYHILFIISSLLDSLVLMIVFFVFVLF